MALATIGIVSIGDMGLGIAKLLIANNYKVVTNATGRSQATQDRAQRNGVQLFSTDAELCTISDYILSIVPPRDALATAHRICSATKTLGKTLFYIDLNAISPSSARAIDDLFGSSGSSVQYLDGGIIGAPPKLKEDGTWYRPSVPVSGPHHLAVASPSGEHLATTLNMKHVSSTIGSATGLKMCFASLSKGFTALAIQSFTTAQSLGVLEELKEQLNEHVPAVKAQAERGLVGMPPKAYRWVNEMEQIAETFEADGGFSPQESVFRSVAAIYDLVANGTELGKETTESRTNGKTAEDVARLMLEGTEKRKLKKD